MAYPNWLGGGPGTISETSAAAVSIAAAGGTPTTARRILETTAGRRYRLTWTSNSATGTFRVGKSARRWNPPPLVSPTVINLNLTGDDQVHGPYADDVDIQIIPKTTTYTLERLQISGGRNIVLIGGHFRPTSTVTAGHINIVNCYGTFYMEGTYIDMSAVGDRDAVNFSSASEESAPNTGLKRPNGSPAANCVMQNVRIANVKGTSAGIHGDAFQPQGDINELLCYKMWISTNYQSFLLEQRLDRADRDDQIGSANLEKITVKRNPTGDATSKIFYFCETETPQFPCFLKDVYGEVQETSTIKAETNFMWPPAASAVGARRVGDTVSWSRINGVVNVGVGPDYAPIASVGLNYAPAEPLIQDATISFVAGTNTYEFDALDDKTFLEFRRTSAGTTALTGLTMTDITNQTGTVYKGLGTAHDPLGLNSFTFTASSTNLYIQFQRTPAGVVTLSDIALEQVD